MPALWSFSASVAAPFVAFTRKQNENEEKTELKTSLLLRCSFSASVFALFLMFIEKQNENEEKTEWETSLLLRCSFSASVFDLFLMFIEKQNENEEKTEWETSLSLCFSLCFCTQEETRTPTPYGIRTSSVLVYHSNTWAFKPNL